MAEPLGVALLGAGLFARDAYLPLLRLALIFLKNPTKALHQVSPCSSSELGNVTASLRRQSKSVRLVAVWSRSSSAGEALLPTIQEYAPYTSCYCFLPDSILSCRLCMLLRRM